MTENDELELSLSLGCATVKPLQIRHSAAQPASKDVLPATSHSDPNEEGGLSSPNSAVSSVVSGGKRGEREENLAGNAADSEAARGISDEEDGEGARKKLRLSKDQSAVLEENFKKHHTLNPKQKFALAKQLNLRPRQVEVWFQNRRARTKLKQTEVDCEVLKRCCEKLTEENRRLQKEVQELRALKFSPQFFQHTIPPTTLTMCPSCERIAISSSSSSSSPMAITNTDKLSKRHSLPGSVGS